MDQDTLPDSAPAGDPSIPFSGRNDRETFGARTAGEEIFGRLIHGDSLAVLKTLPDDSIDSVVCDPPYELGFMDRAWDSSGIAYNVDLWRECLRVLKPGGHLIAFGGSRTYHRLAVAVEDAGFEIRDQLIWAGAQGFPKSLNVSKAIDKIKKVERPVIGTEVIKNDIRGHNGFDTSGGGRGGHGVDEGDESSVSGGGFVRDVTAPGSLEAAEWEGWGTQLKPAHEPMVLARKPLAAKSVAPNVLAHRTGALNIDGCRIPFASQADFDETADKNDHADFGSRPGADNDYGDFSMVPPRNYRERVGGGAKGSSGFVSGYRKVSEAGDSSSLDTISSTARMTDIPQAGRRTATFGAPTGETVEGGEKGEDEGGWVANTVGRWPANVILTDPVFDGDFPDEVVGGGQSIGVGNQPAKRTTGFWADKPEITPGYVKMDGGGKSRFFLIPKAASDERFGVVRCGCPTRVVTSGEFKKGTRSTSVNGKPQRVCVTCDQPATYSGHATVKPIALMRHLVRLVTPPGGVVLDPFLGSGTTAIAASAEGLNWVGIELGGENSDHIAICEARTGVKAEVVGAEELGAEESAA